jgi:exodeoxyribonuclease V alpha subunit
MNLIDELLANEEIAPIDFAIAEKLACGNQDAFLFICFLSKASREGHLCVKIEDNDVFPDPELLLSLSKSTIINGFNSLSTDLISVLDNDPMILPSKPICRQGHYIYFQKNWLYENEFKHHLTRLLKVKPEIEMESAVIKNALDLLWNQGVLLQEQFESIKKALLNTFTIISGGPGTGKTYTAGLLMKTYWDALNVEQKSKVNMVLAAPTGKAASNLQKSIQRAVQGLDGFPILQSQTLHSLLGRRKRASLSHLRADFILIDESSMIDASIMSHLLSCVKSGARLVFLGDPHQLPPVESGALFADMNASLLENRVELKQCLRSDLKGILDFASKVKEGNSKEAMNLLSAAKTDSGLHLIATKEDSILNLRQFFLKYAVDRFPSPVLADLSPSSLIDSFNRFRLLSPMRRGPFGVEEINRLFLNYYRSKIVLGESFVAPIMLTSNDHRLQLFNGEVGVLVKPAVGEEYLLIQSSSGVRKIPGILIPRYEFAYCLSVHKSQGSEFDKVLALFPEGSEVFGREVLYTAATRAKKLLEIWGSDDTLIKTIDRKVKRISGFSR